MSAERGMDIKNFLLQHNLVIALIALFIIMFTLFHEILFSRNVLYSFLSTTTLVGILTLGQATVVFTGGIDLSNGALVGLTSILTAYIALSYGLPVIFGVTLFAALCIGTISGTLVTRFDFPPLIATLVAMGVAQGFTLIITGGAPLALKNNTLASFGVANIGGFPLYSIIWIVLVVFLYLILSKTIFGRHVYAVGDSEKNAYRCGIKTNRIKFSAYIISAILAWCAGVIYACYTQAGAPRAGLGGFNYMLDSITATIIGGIALTGGRGNILDAMLGTMFFVLLYMSVIFFRVSPLLEGAFRGIILLVVVLYAYLRERKRT